MKEIKYRSSRFDFVSPYYKPQAQIKGVGPSAEKREALRKKRKK